MLRNLCHFSLGLRLLAVVVTLWGAGLVRAQSPENAQVEASWQLNLRSRVATSPGSDRFHTLLKPEPWEPRQTAVIVCDVWDSHHSPNAVDRVNELVPRLEAFVQVARAAGATVIHAPSDCMAFYTENPARRRAQQVPQAKSVPSGMDQWCTQIPAEEAGVYPIDQADGGEDDDPERHAAWAAQNQQAGRNPSLPWLRQHPGISINENVDYVTDQGPEVWSILEQHGIQNVMLVGVHVNMCVLGRPFGLRNMVTAGKRTVLVRDLTDSMYNPARWPYVNHHTGTDLIIQHIEKYVCPTITSDQIAGGQPFRFASDQRTRLAVLVAEPEYDTASSLSRFAAEHLGKEFQVEFIHGSETDKADFPSLSLLTSCDAAFLSVRRRPLRSEQMAIIREFVKSGKPLIGIRTSSHPFHLQQSSSENETEFEEWPEFDAEVWGGNYTGHYGVDQLPRITSKNDDLQHPVLGGKSFDFHSAGSLYQNSPLRAGTTSLLWGHIDGAPAHPVAWTFVRSDGGRSFYTSLGHVGDFQQAEFQQLLLRGLRWATKQEPSPIPKNEQGFWQKKPPATMPGTRPWQWDGDVADAMVAGIDRFLLRKIEAAQSERFEHWQKLWSDDSWTSQLELERYRLSKQLGVQRTDSVTERTVEMRLVASPDASSLIGRTPTYEIHRVTWKSFADVWSHGLLVRPIGRAPVANVIAVPDCEVWPEQ
ncbi:MAG: isochorismatase family protein, partial [Planctomycetaceae bacterium]|nr:isochorismatase family protein [Planctomycetaceae bacterium]